MRNAVIIDGKAYRFLWMDIEVTSPPFKYNKSGDIERFARIRFRGVDSRQKQWDFSTDKCVLCPRRKGYAIELNTDG